MVYTTVSAVLTVPYVVPTVPSAVLPYPTQRLFLEMPVRTPRTFRPTTFTNPSAVQTPRNAHV